MCRENCVRIKIFMKWLSRFFILKFTITYRNIIQRSCRLLTKSLSSCDDIVSTCGDITWSIFDQQDSNSLLVTKQTLLVARNCDRAVYSNSISTHNIFFLWKECVFTLRSSNISRLSIANFGLRPTLVTKFYFKILGKNMERSKFIHLFGFNSIIFEEIFIQFKQNLMRS